METAKVEPISITFILGNVIHSEAVRGSLVTKFTTKLINATKSNILVVVVVENLQKFS